MAQLVGVARVIDGTVSVPNGTPFVTQSINIQGRDKQTILTQTNVAIEYDVQISLRNDVNADYINTPDVNVSVGTGGLVANYNYSANFMRLNLHGNASAASPIVDIHAQQNAT